MNFGEVLKELRAERGITQEKLARDLDIPEPTIRRLETSKGKPRTERINQIAAYFGISTDRLLGREIKQTVLEETEEEKLRKIASNKIQNIKSVEDLNRVIDHIDYVESKNK